MGSGKTSTSTSQVSVPPEVLARYNSANAVGNYAAGVQYGTNPDGSQNFNSVTGMKPFTNYGGEFVAPVNNVEASGINQIGNVYQNQAQGYVPGAQTDIGDSYAAASGYTQPATNAAQSGYNAATGLYNGSLTTGQTGVAQGSGLLNSGVATMNQAAGQASGMYGSADSNYLSAANQGQQGLAEAKPWLQGSYAAAQPAMGQVSGLINSAVNSGQGFANQAQGFLGGSTAAVNPNQIDQSEINRYMTPYMGSVIQAQQGLLNQQNAQQLASLKGNAIASGAFGGDRAGVAQANLGQQQSLANAQIMSGLLNQGYSQALGTAQQQQGVNLQAQQANRQAQQFGEQASAALGQQQFNQGLGAAGAQQQLGQGLFNMNQTQGQSLANLGQQAYNMQAGVAQGQAGLGNAQASLGAQQAGTQLNAGTGINSMYSGLAGQQQSAAGGLYNAGVGLGNFYNTTGQQVFNQGQQAGANWLNLGLQSQNAGITGSQAAIGAGQVGQQTQQAQDTALYNQFMQQQGYPFQVAQFLANIAEGTGSLSGSTTTSTQPAPWWSDERLKHDKVRIGKTDEGTPIYKFRYKNDPDQQPHIGLMAQDVEKKHPEAVGLVGGYRTLDYDKIPGREERDVGGSVNGFAPYNSNLGHTGYVPGASLPVGQLKVAQPVANKQDNTLKGLISTGTSALSLGKDVKAGYKSLTESHGGLVRGYDTGGDIDVEPYGDSSDDGYMSNAMKGMKPPRKLATANTQNGSNSSNPLSDISSAVGTAKNIYGLGSGLISILPFLANGGLVRGYDDGGDVVPAPDTGDDTMVKQTPDALDRIVRGIGDVESNHRYDIRGPVTSSGDRAYGAYQVMGNNVGPWSKEILGREMTPDQFLADPEAQHAVAKGKMKQYYDKYQNPDDVASMWFSGKPSAGNTRSDGYNTVPAYISKFHKAMGQSDADLPANDATQASADYAPQSSGLMRGQPQQDSSSSGLMGNIGNLLSGNGWKGDGDNRMLLSVLQGLGTMASSDSRYLGASLLQGLGGGAKAYSEQTKLQSEIAKNSLAMAGQVFKQLPNGNFYNSMSGEEVSAPQHAAMIARLPGMATFVPSAGQAASGVSAPAVPGATQATAPTTMPTQGTQADQSSKQAQRQAVMQEIPSDYHDMNANAFSSATDETNPVALGKQITQLRQQQDQLNYGLQHRGENPAAREALATINQQITDRRNQMKDILTGKNPIMTRDANGNDVYDSKANQYVQDFNNQIEANKKYSTETNVEAKKSFQQQAERFYATDKPAIENILNTAQLMSMTTDTNKLADYQSNLIGSLRSIPWLRDHMPESLDKLQTAYETQNKGAIQQAFDEVTKGLQRAPGAALHAAMQSVVNPTMAPAARYNLVTKAKANLYREQELYDGFDPDSGESVFKYQRRFANDPKHDIVKSYMKRATADTPYFAGMSEPEKQQMPFSRDDSGNVAPTRVQQGVLNPQSPPPKLAPVAKPSMQVKTAADYAKVPSGAVYTDPDGKMRRKP